MHNYYTILAFRIDIGLLAFSIALAMAAILDSVIIEYAWRRRSRALLNIKRHVYEVLLAGQGADDEKFSGLIAQTTPEQFLDITTNRDRELIFFNDSERQIFRKNFISGQKIDHLKKIARGHRNKWKRIEAIMGLGYAGIADSTDVLKKTLWDKDEDISYFSMVALGQIKEIDSAKTLLDYVRKKVSIRYKMISVLEAFPQWIAEEIVKLLTDPDPAVRLWSIKMMSKFANVKYADKAREMMKDPDAEVRAAAAEFLGLVGSSDAEGILKACLKDEEWRVRAGAVKALASLLGAKAVPLVAGLMEDGSLTTVNNVKKVLTDNPKEALPYLEKFLFGNNPIAKNLAVESLEESGWVEKLLNTVASGSDAEAAEAAKILAEIIRSGGRLGFEWVLSNIDQEKQDRVLTRMAKADPKLQEQINKKMKGDIIE